MRYNFQKAADELTQLLRLTNSTDPAHQPEWSVKTMVLAYLEDAYKAGYTNAIEGAQAVVERTFAELEVRQ